MRTENRSNLKEYAAKRDFKKTAEPTAVVKKAKSKKLSFVVQEHHASHLHYDFRLEWDGVLKSWAVPKGPSTNPSEKRLAVEVEDHPVKYGKFEGVIPAHEYGGGQVYIWDSGFWEPEGDVEASLKKGHLDFTLKGGKLKGRWVLVRTRGYPNSNKANWLLMKRTDEFSNNVSDLEPILDGESTVKPKNKKELKAKTSPVKAPKKDLKTSVNRKKKAALKTKPSKSRSSPTLNFIAPQLPLLVEHAPVGDNWIHEMKFDGYRTEALIQEGKISLLTRSGQDWTEKYQSVESSLKALAKTAKIKSAIFDGEIVVLDAQGRSDFQQLQATFKDGKSTFIYFAFDLLQLNGEDLMEVPLIERKERLQELLAGSGVDGIRYSDHIEGNGEKFLKGSCEHDLEGMISKQKDSPYVPGRSDIWVKTKCVKRQEFVIGGFSEGQGSRSGFGALLLGVYEPSASGQQLKYVGKCGTGFDSNLLNDLAKKLKAIEVDGSPFDLKSPRERGLHWVKPKLVAEIKFSNWTKDDVLRVPVFQGLRLDKPAKQIKREVPAELPEKMMGKTMAKKSTAKTKSQKSISLKTVSAGKKIAAAKTEKKSGTSGPVLTHPDKVLFKKEGITKGEVGEYYKTISKFILPHISNRPLSLVRCPGGTDTKCFFQKHVAENYTAHGKTSPLLEIPIEESKGVQNYVGIDSVDGLTTLVQMGAFELHAWNCHEPDIEHPDQFVIDFDPNPDVSFEKVKEGALTLKKLLDQLGLKSFIKTTGGKGLHVHVPIAPLYTWEQIKELSHTLAIRMSEQEPELYTATLSKSARTKKIFIDYLRNGRGSTAVVPYSIRAKKVSSVAMPIEWKDLKALKDPAQFTIPLALAHLKKRKVDPWKDILKTKQKIKLFSKK